MSTTKDFKLRLGLSPPERPRSKYEWRGDRSITEPLIEKQATFEGTTKDEGTAAQKLVAQPAVEGVCNGSLQEMRVHRGTLDRCG